MKAALAALIFLGVGGAPTNAPQTEAAPIVAGEAVTVEAPWTAHINRSDSGELQLNVRERQNSSLGTGIKLADLEGLTDADLRSGKPVTFRLVREAGAISFTGSFRNGEGSGTLRFDGAPAYWSKLAAMGVRNDITERRTGLLGLPLLDVRIDYIAALRREGAIAPLSDYVGMRAVNVRPEMVHEVRPLVAGEMKAHDLMALAALGVTPDYARDMRGAYTQLAAHDLGSMKALGVTAAYVKDLRAAGARVNTASDAQSFRALGISPAAVKRAVAAGKANPSASDVMEMSKRF